MGLVKQAEEAIYLFKMLCSKYRGLRKIELFICLNKKVLSYCLYRLRMTTHDYACRETRKVKDFIERMEIPLRRYHYDGDDPIRILDFLAHFTQKDNIQEISETQAFATLPLFLNGFALIQYDAMAGMKTSVEGGITCWFEAVLYLLNNYAQAKVTTKAV